MMNRHQQGCFPLYGKILWAMFIGLGWLADSGAAVEHDPVIGKPVAGKNADGRLEVFQIDSLGELRHRWQKEPNGNWSAWSGLGGTFFPGIAVAKNADGQLEIFAVDEASHLLRHKHQNAPNGQNWSDWESLGTCAIQSPVAVGQNANGTLEAFAVDAAGNSVKHIWQTSIHGGWSEWADLGGNLLPELFVAQNKDHHLELFGVDAHDGHLSHCGQFVANGKIQWSPWQSLGGAILPGFAVGQHPDGHLELFAVNSTTGRLNHISQTFTGGAGWSAWSDFGVSVETGVAVGNNADGRMEVFGVNGKDSTMLHRWQASTDPRNSRWSPWSRMEGSVLPYPAVSRNQDGNLEIFAINKMDVNTLDHKRQISANSDWLDWFSMDHAPLQYSAHAWQVEDGLPNNMVRAVTQTLDGYLWVGTRGGLARFDGLHFTSIDVADAAGMKNSNISALCVDADGTLWIGTYGGGLARLQGGTFSHYDKSNGLAGNELNVIYQGRDRSLWIGTDTGLSHYKDGKFTNYFPEQGLASEVIRSVCEDQLGNLWIGTAAGLNRFKG
ncbi:MAG: hypothetical protein JWQ04_957, partial [Pedosphaera sp.]|nr:hypothetical protein [Pedosphaera sp.]